jgi:hypothetical protein
MPETIQLNGTNLSLVHKFSNGISTATVPDVCKTPTPGGPVPTPYPNIAQSATLSDGTTTVKGDKAMAAIKGSKFALSNGDQAGTLGGVKSNVFMKEATWIMYSFDVKLDGSNACRFTDPMYHNAENTVNMGGVVNPPVTAAAFEAILKKCVNDAEKDWGNKNGNPDYKEFCKSEANRTRRGSEIEEAASACVADEMNKKGHTDQVATQQSYDRNGPGGSLQTVGQPGEVVPNTVRPDIVLHAPGDATAVRAVYDIKCPCPPGSNIPRWSGSQGADYLSTFRRVPQIVSPGNAIYNGATLAGRAVSGEGAFFMRTAARMMGIPLP